MRIEELAQQALRLIPSQSGHARHAPQTITPLPGLTVVRYHLVTSFEPTIYEPLFCLTLQGGKQTTLGDRAFGARPGQGLLVSQDLPVASRINAAPYLSLVLELDVDVLRSAWDEVAEFPSDSDSRAMELLRVEPALVEAFSRYLALCANPRDAKVLGPLILKEVHYRLLVASSGGLLRRLVRHDSRESAVARAIAQLRKDFRAGVAIPALARAVGMSASAFHKHFKQVTSSSPLQYQKDLRLLEARRLLVRGGVTVSTAAFDVGYESPNQFSREYARKFGVPPSHDARAA